MTVGQAIASVDGLEPNQYSTAQKITWLSELDAQIYAEVIETHESPLLSAFAGHTSTEDNLLVPYPWDGDLYRWGLIAQIRLHNAESVRYNQAISAFSAAYQSFVDWYNRTHVTKVRGTRFVF